MTNTRTGSQINARYQATIKDEDLIYGYFLKFETFMFIFKEEWFYVRVVWNTEELKHLQCKMYPFLRAVNVIAAHPTTIQKVGTGHDRSFEKTHLAVSETISPEAGERFKNRMILKR